MEQKGFDINFFIGMFLIFGILGDISTGVIGFPVSVIFFVSGSINDLRAGESSADSSFASASFDMRSAHTGILPTSSI